MEGVSEDRPGKSRIKSLLVFVLHQFISTWGVGIVAPWMIVLVAPLLKLFGWTIYMTQFHWILTETPYFPVQIVFALFLGFLLGRYLRHGSMLWVWILPSVILCCVVVAFPVIGQLSVAQYAGLSSSSRLSHFFGWGCQPKNRCFDQLMITLPFYSATAYSLGALLPRMMRRIAHTEAATSPRTRFAG
jgi:hypothetical protein